MPNVNKTLAKQVNKAEAKRRAAEPNVDKTLATCKPAKPKVNNTLAKIKEHPG